MEFAAINTFRLQKIYYKSCDVISGIYWVVTVKGTDSSNKYIIDVLTNIGESF
jgi:hypothetical protein